MRRRKTIELELAHQWLNPCQILGIIDSKERKREVVRSLFRPAEMCSLPLEVLGAYVPNGCDNESLASQTDPYTRGPKVT